MKAIFSALTITVIIILVDSSLQAGVKAYPSEDVIIFNAGGQPGGLIDADKAININVKSGHENWVVRYQALTLEGRGGAIPPDRVSINSPYTDGYKEMSDLTVVAKGKKKVSAPVVTGPVRFRLQTTWQDKPGTYTGLLVSPDGAQSINVKLIIDPFTSIMLAPSSLYFDALGLPRIFDALSEIDVKVSSNFAGWTVSCNATPLEGKDGAKISNDSIFIRSATTKSYRDEGAGRGYKKMKKPVILGSGSQTPLLDLDRLGFRLLTTWKDNPGIYEGDIIFTFLIRP